VEKQKIRTTEIRTQRLSYVQRWPCVMLRGWWWQ